MAKPFSADVRIVEGGGLLTKGLGFANADGLSAKGGGAVAWADVAALRKLDRRLGSASSGALVAGGLGLLGGPPVAAMAAAGGALVGAVGGAVEVYALQCRVGGDMLIEISAWRSAAMEKAHAATLQRPAVATAALQRLRGLLPGRTKGEA
jgi:hypothetical protein